MNRSHHQPAASAFLVVPSSALPMRAVRIIVRGVLMVMTLWICGRAGAQDFVSEVLPILRDNCLACHSASERQGALVLETAATILTGGDSGPAVVPGKPGESLLWLTASHQVEPAMPPADNDVAAMRLSDAQLSVIERWISAGAVGSATTNLGPRSLSPIAVGIHPIQAVALTGDGQLAAISRANQVELIHVPTGNLITRLADPALGNESTLGPAHLDLVQAIEFDASGNRLASASFREVKIWIRPRNVTTWEANLAQPILQFAVSDDRSRLAVALNDGTIAILAADTGAVQTTLRVGSDRTAEPLPALAFSPDGNQLASAGASGAILIWEIATNSVVQTIENGAPVMSLCWVPWEPAAVGTVASENSAAVPPDTQGVNWRLVSGAADNRLRVWDLNAQVTEEQPAAPALVAEGHGREVIALARVPNTAKQIWSGSLDGTMRRWNLENGQAFQQINHGSAITSIAVRADGERLATGSDSSTLKLWRSNGQQVIENRGEIQRRAEASLARQRRDAATTRVNQLKQRLLAAEQDLPVRQTASQQADDRLTAANDEVTKLTAEVATKQSELNTAAAAALTAVAASKEAERKRLEAVTLVDRAKQQLRLAEQRLQRLTAAANASPNDANLQQLLTAGREELTGFQTQVQTAESAAAEPTRIAMEAATAANDAATKAKDLQQPFNELVIKLQNAAAAQVLQTQQQLLSKQELTAAEALVPARRTLVEQAEAEVVTANQTLEAAEAAIRESELPVRSVSFTEDGSRLLSGSDRPRFDLWDAELGGGLLSFSGHAAAAPWVVSLNSESVISASVDGTVRCWQLDPAWQLERTLGSVNDSTVFEDRVTSLDFDFTGTRLAVGSGVPSRNGALSLFDLANGNRLFHLPDAHADSIYGVRFSPDGKRLATVGADRVLWTFDVEKGVPIRRFEGHTNHILAVDWKGDGQVLASASADMTIKVWDAETADQQTTIENQFRRAITSMQFVGEGDSVIAAGGDKQVRLFNSTNGGNQRNYGGALAWLHSLAATPDLQTVVAGDAQGRLYVWNGQNGQLVRTIEPQESLNR